MATSTSPAVRSILLASPPGQFDLILEDLRLAASNSMPDADVLSAIRAEWATSTGHSIVETSAADKIDDKSDGCIFALRKAMDDYLGLKFSSPGVHSAHQVMRSTETCGDATTINITTYAARIDLNNHNAGSWKACYTVSPSSGVISGSVAIVAHTFENGGNVQLHSDICLNETNADRITTNDGTEKKTLWATSIVKQIQSWEDTEVMNKLVDMYEHLSNEYFKSLRRVMPITRTKMEWNVMAHRVRVTLGKGHDKDKFKH